MWDVSARFLAALRGAHQMVTTVDVMQDGITFSPYTDLKVVGGSLTRDRNSAQYSRLTVEIADPTVAPTLQNAPLGPAGFELALYRGLEFTDGTQEVVPLGIFPIQTSVVDGVSLTTRIDAADRSQRVADARFEIDYAPVVGNDFTTEIAAIVDDVIPGTEFIADSPSENVPVGIVYAAESDRWAVVQAIATAIGYEVFFDGLGRCVMRNEPDLSSNAFVWEIDEGASGVLVSVDLTWSRQPSFNRVIVTGTNARATAVFRGVATDIAADSPSAYGGPFGPKPIFVSNAHVASNAAALNAARALLRRVQGVAMSVDLSAVPNPALVPGDVITVHRDLLNLDMAVIIDSITLGLGPEDPMTCQVRSRQEAAA